eukprot:m.378690 g.378690  ORF g.378690 m.378690 type:complete len:143 (+) comp20936_c0_seq2:150-578(+)
MGVPCDKCMMGRMILQQRQLASTPDVLEYFVTWNEHRCVQEGTRGRSIAPNLLHPSDSVVALSSIHTRRNRCRTMYTETAIAATAATQYTMAHRSIPPLSSGDPGASVPANAAVSAEAPAFAPVSALMGCSSAFAVNMERTC